MVKYISTGIQINWPKKKERAYTEWLAGLWKATWLLPVTGICAAALGISEDLFKFFFAACDVSSSPFWFFQDVAIQSSYHTDLDRLACWTSGGWCNGCWCCDGCDTSWWAACWPALRCDGWFGRGRPRTTARWNSTKSSPSGRPAIHPRKTHPVHKAQKIHLSNTWSIKTNNLLRSCCPTRGRNRWSPATLVVGRLSERIVRNLAR